MCMYNIIYVYMYYNNTAEYIEMYYMPLCSTCRLVLSLRKFAARHISWITNFRKIYNYFYLFTFFTFRAFASSFTAITLRIQHVHLFDMSDSCYEESNVTYRSVANNKVSRHILVQRQYFNVLVVVCLGLFVPTVFLVSCLETNDDSRVLKLFGLSSQDDNFS